MKSALASSCHSTQNLLIGHKDWRLLSGNKRVCVFVNARSYGKAGSEKGDKKRRGGG